MARHEKYSKYKGVSKLVHGDSSYEKHNKKPWRATLAIKGEFSKQWFSSYCKTEREAAIAYDKKMIELGRPPVNILKPVQ